MCNDCQTSKLRLSFISSFVVVLELPLKLQMAGPTQGCSIVLAKPKLQFGHLHGRPFISVIGKMPGLRSSGMALSILSTRLSKAASQCKGAESMERDTVFSINNITFR